VSVRPQRMLPGARSEPGSPRARLRAPVRVADVDVQSKEEEEEEASLVPELAKRGDGDRAGTSQFIGVTWNKAYNTWTARCKGKHLGNHTTEEAAARAYGNYLQNGVVPNPAERSGWFTYTSQFKGVSWDKKHMKWRAQSEGTQLGYHVTEVEAARAYSKYLEDGIDPVKHRSASTSQFTGVNWDKNADKWRATCKGTYLGLHTSERSAARAYNVEAKRGGRHLNVIPPAEAAGVGASAGTGVGAGGDAGLKRTAPKIPAAPATTKKTKRAPS